MKIKHEAKEEAEGGKLPLRTGQGRLQCDQSRRCAMDNEVHVTWQGGVAGPTHSRRHKAGLGISTCFMAFPKVITMATPQIKGYFTQQLLSAAQGCSKLEASLGETRGRGLSVFPSCVPGAC